MRYIDKTHAREPKSLIQYRKSADPEAKDIFDDYKDKDELRQVLLKEQGFICCYCMQRIQGEYNSEIGLCDTKIEHWKSQSKFNGKNGNPDLRLDYKNLMASCLGNTGKPGNGEHCDTRKGDKQIIINPTDPSCELKIHYGVGGEIFSSDPVIQDELGRNDKSKGILNLNNQTFRDNRRAALKEVINSMNKEKRSGEWKKQFIQAYLDKVESKNKEGCYTEYIGYILFFLQKRLSRAKD